MAKVDYYRVLGLRPTATREEIRRAYRRLARRVHPDAHPERQNDVRATERMALLNEAYAVLADPGRRAVYDMQQQGDGVGVDGGRGQARKPDPRTATAAERGPARRATYTGQQQGDGVDADGGSGQAGEPDPQGDRTARRGARVVVLTPSVDQQARLAVLALLLAAAGVYGANLTVSRGSLLGVVMMATGLLSGALCAMAVMPTFHGRLVLTGDGLIEQSSLGLFGERAYGYDQICDVHWKAKRGLDASTRILIDYYKRDRSGQLQVECYQSKWLMPVDDPHTLYHLLRERAAARKYDFSRPSWWAVVVHARELVVTVVVVFGTVVAALLWSTSPGG